MEDTFLAINFQQEYIFMFQNVLYYLKMLLSQSRAKLRQFFFCISIYSLLLFRATAQASSSKNHLILLNLTFSRLRKLHISLT